MSPPYSHESNGIAERFNRTITTMARAMLNGGNLPLSLWSEAISTAVYFKNRIPHKAVKESTPYEALHGKKPSIQHLQPVGRKCYVHIPEEQRGLGSKLLPRALEGKFIGYTESTKIFRIYIPSQHKVTETRQVRFTHQDSGEVVLPLTQPTTPTFTSINLPSPVSSLLRSQLDQNSQQDRNNEQQPAPPQPEPEPARPEVEDD